MPIVALDRAYYASAYRFNAEPEGHPAGRAGLRLGYTRHALLPLCRLWADGLLGALRWGANPPDAVVVANAGYGFLVEALIERGVNALALETSADLLNVKDSDERAEIEAALQAAGRETKDADAYVDGSRAKLALLNEPLTTPASQDRLKAAAGGGDFAVVTDHLLHVLTDAEAVAESARWHGLAGVTGVVHLTGTLDEGNHPGFNWKLLADWKALLPDDTLVDHASFEVL